MANKHPRVVAIGDLNASLAILKKILFGTGLINAKGRWKARRAHLIQVGDFFNRGPQAKGTFEYLLSLAQQAPEFSSQVTVLLGNHEVMTALGNEAYCTAEEYLAFATAKQRAAWPGRLQRATRRIYRDHGPRGPILPLGPRVEAWKIHNVPGRSAMRKALGPRAKMGKAIRALPLAVVEAGCVFVHAPVAPKWARWGLEGLNQMARNAWDLSPTFVSDLDPQGILHADNGPLWNRQLTLEQSQRSRDQLRRSLKLIGAKRMVIGHTQTGHIPGGKSGQILLRQRGKLVCIDVGLGRAMPSPCAALLIEDGVGSEWTPDGTRPLWKR